MLLYLDDHNEVQLTEKILLIKDLKALYNKHKKNHEVAMAHFATMYYMYHFDSRFLWLYRNDEVTRLREVRKFVANGKDVKICNTMQRAMKTYKQLYGEESVSIYLTMKDGFEKYKKYLDRAVLVAPNPAEIEHLPPEEQPFLIEAKELMALNKAIPEQWKMLDKFKRELEEFAKAEVDIYGGGELGAYED